MASIHTISTWIGLLIILGPLKLNSQLLIPLGKIQSLLKVNSKNLRIGRELGSIQECSLIGDHFSIHS